MKESSTIKTHILRKISTLKIGEIVCVLNNDGTVFRVKVTDNPIRNSNGLEVNTEKENGDKVIINDTDIIFNP